MDCFIYRLRRGGDVGLLVLYPHCFKDDVSLHKSLSLKELHYLYDTPLDLIWLNVFIVFFNDGIKIHYAKLCLHIKSSHWDTIAPNRTEPYALMTSPVQSPREHTVHVCDLLNPEPSARLLCVKTGIINLPGSFSSHSSDDLLPAVSKLNAALQLRREEA